MYIFCGKLLTNHTQALRGHFSAKNKQTKKTTQTTFTLIVLVSLALLSAIDELTHFIRKLQSSIEGVIEGTHEINLNRPCSCHVADSPVLFNHVNANAYESKIS